MIRVNLLKSLQSQAREAMPTEILETPKSGLVWIFVPLALFLIGAAVYFLLRFGQGAPPVATAPALPLQPAVPDTSMEARSQRALPAYSGWASARRIAWQYSSATRLLRDLQAATPPGVGFARMAFVPPAAFYVQGVAAGDADLQRFQSALSTLPGVQLTQTQVHVLGTDSAARLFVVSGNFLGRDTLADTLNRVAAAAEAGSALRQFTRVAAEQGLEMDPVVPRDSSASALRYHVEARGGYAKLLAALEGLRAEKTGVGFQRLGLQARGGDTLAVQLELVVYLR